MKILNRIIPLLVIIAFAFCYAPPPEPASAQFSGQAQWARAPSTGTANAQSVALPNYNLQVGVPITFVVGTALNNTDAATLNINGTGAKVVRRSTNVGSWPLVGGELVAEEVVTVVFDGSNYTILGNLTRVGAVSMFRGTVDPGWQIEDGTCFSTLNTRYSPLFSKIGVQFGSCGANTFKVADTRGRIDAGTDDQGNNGAAGIITVCTFVQLGNTCGNQQSGLSSVNQLPPYTPQGTVSTFTPAGTVSTFTPSGSISFNVATPTVGQSSLGLDTGGTNAPVNPVTLTATFTGNAITPTFAGVPITPTFSGVPVGAGAAFSTISPVFAGYRAIKL